MKGIIPCKTKSSAIQLNMSIETICSDMLVPYQFKEKFDKCCETSCKNYGLKWACPPYSPTYTIYKSDYKYLTICVLAASLNQFDYINNKYLKIKAANSIMKSRVDRVLRELVKTEHSKQVSTGSCRLCKPCKKKLGNPCKHPQVMAYSFEALGIDVEKVSLDILNHELKWYKNNELPEYTSVVAGILLDKPIEENKLFDLLLRG